MNKKLLFLAILLLFSGFIVVFFLSQSGKEFYSIYADDSEMAGALLYNNNCAKCHGFEGEGIASYPPIRNSTLSQEAIQKIIVKGYHEMPAFPNLSENDLQLLVNYVGNF